MNQEEMKVVSEEVKEEGEVLLSLEVRETAVVWETFHLQRPLACQWRQKWRLAGD